MECDPEELHFLGITGIYREAVHILRPHRRRLRPPPLPPRHRHLPRPPPAPPPSAAFLLFKAAYLLFSLLSTAAAAVCSVASVYSAKHDALSFPRVLSVVPRVWHHLEVYLGDYVPLKASDVQIEQLHV